MFKKVFLMCSIIAVGVMVTGCGFTLNNVVLENMSEITKEFYIGESDDFYVTLSVGERESDFRYNGESTENVEKALLSIKFNESLNKNVIWIQVASGENSVQVEAFYNELSERYMVDLIDEIEIGDTVFVNYDGSVAELEKVSADFNIQYDEAISIACENLQSELSALKSFSHFNGECYLIVLSQKENNFDELYWVFTCIPLDGENFSIIISTSDGSVIMQS